MNRFVTALLIVIGVIAANVAMTSLREQRSSTAPVMQIIPIQEGESVIINQPSSATSVMQIISI